MKANKAYKETLEEQLHHCKKQVQRYTDLVKKIEEELERINNQTMEN